MPRRTALISTTAVDTVAASTTPPQAPPFTAALLLDVRGVAAFCSLSPATIWRLCQRGAFPAPLHIGRAARWRRSDVEAWVAALSAGGDHAGAA